MEMESHRFPADHAGCDGAAAGGTIVAVPNSAAATGGTDCSGRPCAAAEFSPAADSIRTYSRPAHDHGSGGGPRHRARARADRDTENPHAAGRDLSAEPEARPAARPGAQGGSLFPWPHRYGRIRGPARLSLQGYEFAEPSAGRIHQTVQVRVQAPRLLLDDLRPPRGLLSQPLQFPLRPPRVSR